jgi:acylpyruvate hydrolase
MNLFYLN